MSIHNSKSTHALAIPDMPGLARDLLKLLNGQAILDLSEIQGQLTKLVEQYPQFFESVLKIINSDHLNLTAKVNNVQEAVEQSGLKSVLQIVLIHLVYLSLSQYKINGLDRQVFWQDVLRRAVCSRLLSELLRAVNNGEVSKGFNAIEYFCAGFMQDIGFILLFFESPEKGVLWEEFHKREPEARRNMEQQIFNSHHEAPLEIFMEKWGVFPELKQAILEHHSCDESQLSGKNSQLCKVLNCVDWLSAVFTAEDKSYAINRCRTQLSIQFNLTSQTIESLLAVIPGQVDEIVNAFSIEVQEHIAFSQILYQANIRLNEDNDKFQELTLRLDQAIDERDRLAKELDRDLSMAREIQKSLLPVSRENDYPVHGVNLSAKTLSGDFYDFFEVDNGDIYFNLGDVSGKGVNAALLMAKTSSLFRCLGKRIHNPAELLYEINNELCETSVHGMFVTMVAGVLNPQKNSIKLVNAGNPPALLFVHNEVCREFEATAPPLGVMPDITYTEYDIELNSGCLYLYSDGVTEGYINSRGDSETETTGFVETKPEQKEADLAELGLTGLFKLIATMPPGLSAQERMNRIVEKFSHSSRLLRDDVTMLVIENQLKNETN